MARRNIVSAVTLLAFTAWYGWLTASLPERAQSNIPGPSFFPTLITIALGLLSAALLVRGVMQLREIGSRPVRRPLPAAEMAMIALFVTYLVALSWVGFLPASIPFFAGLMLLYGCRNWLAVAAASLAVPVALYYLFRHGFNVVLPTGIF